MKLSRTAMTVVVIAAVTLAFILARAQVPDASAGMQSPVPQGVHPTPSPTEPYVYRKENDNLYIIAEIHQPFPKEEIHNPIHTQQMGLVIGTEKAALIDTGLGLADLRAVVEKLTDKPVIVLNTHGHLDHVGANQQFDISYIHEADEQAMLSSTRENRLHGYCEYFMPGNDEMCDFAKANMLEDKPFKYEFIKAGDRIDLGGVEIEVVGFPGHSPGSLSFIDRRDNVVFCGDSLLFRVQLGSRESLAQYLESLDHFAEATQGIDTIINGHQWFPFHRSDIDEMRELGLAVLNREITGTPQVMLGGERMIYEMNGKKIGLRDDVAKD